MSERPIPTIEDENLNYSYKQASVFIYIIKRVHSI